MTTGHDFIISSTTTDMTLKFYRFINGYGAVLGFILVYQPFFYGIILWSIYRISQTVFAKSPYSQ